MSAFAMFSWFLLVSLVLAGKKEDLVRGLRSSSSKHRASEKAKKIHVSANPRNGVVIVFDGSQGSSYFIGTGSICMDMLCTSIFNLLTV